MGKTDHTTWRQQSTPQTFLLNNKCGITRKPTSLLCLEFVQTWDCYVRDLVVPQNFFSSTSTLLTLIIQLEEENIDRHPVPFPSSCSFKILELHHSCSRVMVSLKQGARCCLLPMPLTTSNPIQSLYLSLLCSKCKAWDPDPLSPFILPFRLKETVPALLLPQPQWDRQRHTASSSCYCFSKQWNSH